ncbi:MAG: haloacid dehalogenase-like hydrolase [Candidatus Krumholzibacteria bacterium]|nr:haloacid dehalogenase-like hydrolase [Candidatus Krumholzibacteria bacterium]
MSSRKSISRVAVALTLLLAFNGVTMPALAAEDPLPSWNDGPVKTSIMEFVRVVTAEGYAAFVPPEERIAVFDNDGTLWSEQPMYFQRQFAIDRIKALAGDHPEWKSEQPFKAVLENDMAALDKSGLPGLMQLIMVSHADMTTTQFGQIVSGWLSTALHPRFKRPYTDLVFQPMLELLGYLRDNGFKTFIVSGGGIDFMRVWAEMVYGVPPEQVIGSSIKTGFEVRNGVPVLVRLPELDFVNDRAAKPMAIHKFIGRRPILAFGNSDGDLLGSVPECLPKKFSSSAVAKPVWLSVEPIMPNL